MAALLKAVVLVKGREGERRGSRLEMFVECESLVGYEWIRSADAWKQRTGAWEIDVGQRWSCGDQPRKAVLWLPEKSITPWNNSVPSPPSSTSCRTFKTQGTVPLLFCVGLPQNVKSRGGS